MFRKQIIEGCCIPLENGNVPDEALHSHFVSFSKRPGLDAASDKNVVDRPFTPEKVAKWWYDTGGYDLKGIDTADSNYWKNRITFAGSDDAKDVLESSFTPSELQKIGKEGLVISFNLDSGAEYLRPYDSHLVRCSSDCIEKDAAVHELVHILRLNRRGLFKSRLSSGVSISKKDVALEEALTTAETLARFQGTPGLSYYSFLEGDSEKLMHEDLRKLKGNLNEAAERVVDNWNSLNISKLDLGHGSAADILKDDINEIKEVKIHRIKRKRRRFGFTDKKGRCS